MNALSILICDNQPLTRAGIIILLKNYFNQKITIREVKTKDELFEQLKAQPDILIIDFDLLDFSQVSELNTVKKIAPNTGILVVTDNQTPDDIIKVLDCGINNFILKSSGEQELLDAFNATVSSKKYFSNEVLEVLLQRKSSPRQNQEIGKLTLAEIEIVRLITQGMTTKEIALIKHLSFHTIITHRKNIFRKLGIGNSSELLMYALRAGIIDSSEYYI